MKELKYNYAFIGYEEYSLISLSALAEDMKIVINTNPWEAYHSVLRTICRLHFSSKVYKIIDLPFKGLWKYGICKADFDNDRPICFWLCASKANIYVKGLIPYIRKKYKNCAIVLHCTDKVEWYKKRFGDKNFHDVMESVDLIVTYNPVDAEKYGFKISPPIIPDYSTCENTTMTKPSDLLYVGRGKGREDLLHAVYNNAKEHGLKCDFTIIGVPEEKRLKETDINYERYLDYREVIDKVNMTRCILNIPQEGTSGLTLRDLEAIGNGKYLLTSDLNVLSFPLADEKQVIIMDENGNADYSRIAMNYERKSIDFQDYCWISRLEWIERELESNSRRK